MYVGRKYTATVTGSVWRAVTCEHCRLQWAYKLTRKAEGTGRSAYFLDNSGASRRADDEAETELKRKLENDVDAIPCPRCQRYQQAMFGQARYEEYGHWYGIALVVAIGALIFCGVTGGHHQSWFYNWTHLPGAGIFGVAIGMVLYGGIRSKLFDPNAELSVRERLDKPEKPKSTVVLRDDYEAVVAEAVKRGKTRKELADIRWSAAA
jgi:hypothetical protein